MPSREPCVPVLPQLPPHALGTTTYPARHRLPPRRQTDADTPDFIPTVHISKHDFSLLLICQRPVCLRGELASTPWGV